jgi:predicted dehydrogenase
MVQPIRWGILGTGWIANEFAQAVRSLPDAELVAVGSRTPESARAFAESYRIPHRHASYESLAQDPEVEVVYVATPNPFHEDHAMLCLAAGKAVLCEKPFTLNARQAESLIQAARDKGLFLMEAMWSRFFPLMARLRSLLAEGVIGDVQILVADLCLQFDFDPADRRYALKLGGGALLDLGVYPISLASMVLGPPEKSTTMAHLGETGVDEQACIILGHGGGRMSTLFASIRVNSPTEALLIGTKGQIRIHPWWIRPSTLSLKFDGQADTTIDVPYEGNGYQFEAIEVMECLRSGKLESDLMPLDETLSIMRTLDAIRAQWGLTYPGE